MLRFRRRSDRCRDACPVAGRALWLSLVLFGTNVSTAVQAQEFIGSPVEACKDKLLLELGAWDSEIERAIRRVKRGLESKADYERLKQVLLDDTKLLGLIDLRSDWALQAGELFQTIKTKANLIEDLLAFHPAFKATKDVIRIGTFTVRNFYDALKFEQSVTGLVEKGTQYTAYKTLAGLNPATNAVTNLAENVATIVRMPEDHAKFKLEMEGQLARLDREIAKAEQMIESARRDIEIKEKIRQAIDLYCERYPSDVGLGSAPEQPSSSPQSPGTTSSPTCELRYTDHDGDSGTYSGDCRNGQPHGFGQVAYDNSGQFQGQFVNGKKMAREALFGRTGRATRANGETIKQMAREPLFGRTGRATRANGETINSMAREPLFGRTGGATRANGETINSMARELITKPMVIDR